MHLRQMIACSLLLVASHGFSAGLDAASGADTPNEASPAPGTVGISTLRYATGGLVGSTLGFGSGHAIQRRYWVRGALATGGEVAGLVFMLSGLADISKNSKDDGSTQSSHHHHGDWDLTGQISSSTTVGANRFFVGVVVFCGTKIWEMIDVWHLPRESRTSESLQAVGPRIEFLAMQVNENQVPGIGLTIPFM